MSNLNLAAPVNSLSYGRVGSYIARGISKQRKTSLFPIGQVQVESQGEAKEIQELVNNQATVDIEAPSLRLYHQFDLVQRIGRGVHIGWPIFELDEFTARENRNLNSCDELIVCSEWARNILESKFCKPCNVVPLGVDRTIFFEENSPWSTPYTFLCVGKTEVRKGHDILPHLFAKALPKDGKWQLNMLWGNPFLNKDEKSYWEGYYRSILGNHVMFCDRLDTQTQVANEMRIADCGISISRAEGWDLPLLELMSCGKPVIATDCSAHTEFCTSANAWMVDVTETEVANDGKWFHGQGNWAKLGEMQQEQICHYINMNYKAGKGVVNEEGIKTAKKFSWESSVERLEYILKGHN